jgi:cytochrome c-type biogenesis protein CcmH
LPYAAIAAAIAAVAFALPRVFLRRDRARSQAGGTSGAATWPAVALALAAAVAGVACMAIGILEFSGVPTSPAETHSSSATAEASGRAGLARHLETNPRDGRAWVLLARMDFDANRYADAAGAYERALASSPKVAGDPGIWCELADALGMAQGGSLAGRPRELVLRALTMDPAHTKALEMAGSAAFEAGDYASASRFWKALLARFTEDSRERRELVAAIARTEERIPAPRPSQVSAPAE